MEDDHDSRVPVRTYLEYVGFEVLEAHCGDEALRQAGDDGPDVVLTDIAVPRIDAVGGHAHPQRGSADRDSQG